MCYCPLHQNLWQQTSEAEGEAPRPRMDIAITYIYIPNVSSVRKNLGFNCNARYITYKKIKTEHYKLLT